MKTLITFMLSTLFIYPVQSRSETLPQPSGEYSVGVTYLSFTDNDRKELFDNSGESSREITVKAWYPSDDRTEPEKYLLDAEAEFAMKYLRFPALFKDLISNSSRDVPVSSKQDRYPILIFSHGWGEHYSQNTILMEELASHGYIVFSISHHYECKFSSYPDGRLIYIDMNNARFQRIMQEQQNPNAMELLMKMYNATSDEERMQVFVETSKMLPTLLTESPRYWGEDIAFVIDELEDVDSGSEIFRDKLDMNLVGVFGMSMGGIATTEICMTDERIKAGMNIDGGLYGSMLEGKVHIPFMFLNSKRYLGYGNIFTDISTSDCHSFSVRDSDHYNYSDYSVYPMPSVSFLMGTIDGGKMIEIINVMTLAFFDKYLKGNEGIDLIDLAKRYPEIETATKVKQR